MRTLHSDPNSSGGNGTTSGLSGANAAFSSKQAWESYIDGVLTEAEQCITHRNGAAVDTVQLIIADSTTTATNYIEIIGDDTYWCSGKYDNTKDILQVDNDSCLYIYDDHVRLIKQQIETTNVSSNGKECIHIENIGAAGSDVRIERCVLKGHANNTYWQYIVLCNDGDVTLKISNSVIYGGSTNSNGVGLRLTAVGTAYIYNTTIDTKQGIGLQLVAGTAYAKNIISLGSSIYDFYESGGTLDINYCASEDNTADDQGGTGNHINHTFTFVDAANGDYHLGSTDTGAIDLGTDLSGDANYPISVDIDGVTRSGTWDIGADEYVATVTAKPWYYYAQN